MRVRVSRYDEENDKYFLVSYTEFSDYSEVFKMLYYIKENNIPLEINTADVVDCPGEEHYIKDISFVMPDCGGMIQSYIAVYLN